MPLCDDPAVESTIQKFLEALDEHKKDLATCNEASARSTRIDCLEGVHKSVAAVCKAEKERDPFDQCEKIVNGVGTEISIGQLTVIDCSRLLNEIDKALEAAKAG